MKKLALVLALGVVGLTNAQAAEYTMSSGRLLFHGGLTVSGCDLTSNVGKAGSAGNGDIDIYMPNQLSVSYLKPMTKPTAEAFDALPSQAKYSGSINGADNGFTMNIECPAAELSSAIAAELGLATAPGNDGMAFNIDTFLTDLDARGVLKLASGAGAGEGGFIKNEDDVGLLAPATSSVASGVGIAFLRKDGPGAGTNGRLVNFTPGSDEVQSLTWNKATNTSFLSPDAPNSVTAKASYDFAYTPIGTAQALTVGSGELFHIVSFRFVYDDAL